MVHEIDIRFGYKVQRSMSVIYNIKTIDEELFDSELNDVSAMANSA